MRALIVLALIAGVAHAGPTSFTVEVHGQGRPVILIPGLGCPGAIWDDTVKHLANAQTHVLTLAGYAGTPPIDAPLSTTVRGELAAYIREHKLDHPVIIGHSLGGFIAYWLAASEPDLVGPTIAVDAFPALGYDPDALGGITNLAAGWKRLDAQAFADYATVMFQAMATDQKRIAPVIAAVLKSDRRTFADSFVELYKIDLRPQLARIRARVLVVLADGPYQQLITQQVAGIPTKTIVVVPRSRHFVMFDDPKAWFRAADGFLSGR